MEVYKDKQGIIKAIEAFKAKKLTIGMVPTMGALHQGHLQLVKKALNENDIVVVSNFVNPTQFDNKNDLVKYPRTLDADVSLLQTVSTNKILVYAPTVNDIY